MDVVAVLQAARAKIEQGWCRYRYAVDKNGVYRDPKEKDAVCWCILGAIQTTGASVSDKKIYKPFTACLLAKYGDQFVERLDEDDATVTYPRMVSFNDDPNTTQADVLALIDCAIERVRATPQEVQS